MTVAPGPQIVEVEAQGQSVVDPVVGAALGRVAAQVPPPARRTPRRSGRRPQVGDHLYSRSRCPPQLRDHPGPHRRPHTSGTRGTRTCGVEPVGVGRSASKRESS
jgi:hypothetical protein